MILPIVGYGRSVLRVPTKDIDNTYPELEKLIEDMFETMYRASGVGLAAPQVNLPISVLVIDADPFKENYPEGEGFKRAMINPEVLEIGGEPWAFEEGCLSLPGIHENVTRPANVKVRYYDEKFVQHEEELSGICARVFQHEYDHLQGKVFVDRISNIRKAFLKKKLSDISSNRVRPDYKMMR
ncbi:MAG: peptide deformylase [Bacteroidales bacterium]|nr:peptide deformylase [Candidatus Scybalousia scybalohippi]MCQ2326924.1 peptide deformylase [Bacteroidales bacterium]